MRTHTTTALKVTVLSLIAAGVMAAFALSVPSSEAKPNNGNSCDRCHPRDEPNTWVTVTVVSETDTTITYDLAGSDNYDAPEGWAISDPSDGYIEKGYGPGTFTLPKDGVSYGVWWVDDADSCYNNPPSCSRGGSAWVEVVATSGPTATATGTNTPVPATDTPTNTPVPATATATATPALPDLTVAKSDLPDPVASDDALTYYVDVTNAGAGSASSVRLVDTPDAGFAYSGYATTHGSCTIIGSPTGGTLDCDLGALAPAEVANITITGSISSPSGATVQNTATVDPEDAVAEEDETNNSVTITTTVLAPTPTQTSTSTPVPTNTPGPTDTPTNTPVPTNTPASTPVPTDTPTNTPIPTDTPANTPTYTPVPTDTPTNTPVPTDTPTNTPVPTNTPTNTPIPTDTPTNTPVPTDTPTNTPIPPTNTPTFTPINTPTYTPVPPTNTPTFTPTDTPVPPTDTPTPTSTPVIPPTATPTNTPVPPTNTPTFTPTYTPVPPTNTPTFTPTDTPVPPTNTPTNTPVPPTDTPVTPTNTPTNTPAPPTDTPVPPTNTPVPPTATTEPPVDTPTPGGPPTPGPSPTCEPEPGLYRPVYCSEHDVGSPDHPTCKQCHIPHRTLAYYLWARVPSNALLGIGSLCFSCHDGTVADLGYFIPDPELSSHPVEPEVEGEDCDRCHDPHRGDHWEFTTEAIPSEYRNANLCTACHDTGTHTHPIDTLTDLPQDRVWDPYGATADFSGTLLWDAAGEAVATAGDGYIKCETCHMPHGANGTGLNSMPHDDSGSSMSPICDNCHD